MLVFEGQVEVEVAVDVGSVAAVLSGCLKKKRIRTRDKEMMTQRGYKKRRGYKDLRASGTFSRRGSLGVLYYGGIEELSQWT